MWLQCGQLEKADSILRYALALDPTLNALWIQIYADLGEIKRLQGRNAEAEDFFKKAIGQEKSWQSSAHFDEAHHLYGHFLLAQNREPEARAQFEKCRELRPKGWRQAYAQALLAAKHGQKTEALDWLERSLDRYCPRAQMILEEPLFEKIRGTKRFRALMLKHFR